MRKPTPFKIPDGAIPVRPVPTISNADPNFYDQERYAHSEQNVPIEPMELDQDRGMPAPRALEHGGSPFKLDPKG